MTQHALITTIANTPNSGVIRSSIASLKPNRSCNNVPCLDAQTVSLSSNQRQSSSGDASISLTPVSRRNVIALSIGGVILGLNDNDGEMNAWAAARRPPPTPPGEKKDPNVSGVQAKIIASRKRKEAMKEAMAKQRDRGIKVEE